MYNISEIVLQEIKQIYSEHKDLINSIYLTGSRCLPFELTFGDIDLMVVVDNEEAKLSLKQELNLSDTHKFLLSTGDRADILICSKAELNNFLLNI